MMLWMLLLCLWPQCVTPLHGLHVITCAVFLGRGRVTLLLALTQLLLLVLLVCLVDIVDAASTDCLLGCLLLCMWHNNIDIELGRGRI